MSVLQCLPVLLVLALSLSVCSCKLSDNRGFSPTQQVERPLPWGLRLIESYQEQQANDESVQAQSWKEPQLIESYQEQRANDETADDVQEQSWKEQRDQIQEQEGIVKSVEISVKSQKETSSTRKKKLNTLLCDVQNDQRSPKKFNKNLSMKMQMFGSCLSFPTKKAECPPGQLYCDIPTVQSTGQAKTCIKTTGHSISRTLTLGPFWHYIGFIFPRLEVHTLPIGQGDCNIIYCPNRQDAVLFDCGSTSSRDHPRLSPEFIQDKFLSKVQHLTIMLSHGDQDHYNYLPRMFPVSNSASWRSKIQKIIIGGNKGDYSCTSAQIKPWLSEVQRLHIPIEEAVEQTILNLCNDKSIHFHIISANKGNLKNEKSIVMKLSQDGCASSLLFTGDMEHNAANDLATTEPYKTQLRSTHYKVAHHGASSRANKENWVAIIRPLEAHISSAYIGSYGHPRCDAVRQIMNVGSIGFTNPMFSSSTHPFMCSNIESDGSTRKKKTPVTGDICHRFFSTTPEPDKMCVIKLAFNSGGPADTDYYCGSMAQWESAYSEIECCPPEEEEEDDFVV